MTTVALLIGREGSTGFSGENVYMVLGRPLIAYRLLAARESIGVEHTFPSTDPDTLMRIAGECGAETIDRPTQMATSQALGEDAFVKWLPGDLRTSPDRRRVGRVTVPLMANSPMVTRAIIDRGVELLRADAALDSAVSVSRYNMWSPLRARRLKPDGTLQPFVPFETFGDPASVNCNRDSQGDVWFTDMRVSVARPHCLENLETGLLPHRLIGRWIALIESWGGSEIDYEWQIAGVESWLHGHGAAAAPVPAGG